MINDITVKGAREHNLKNVSVTLPKNKMIVFTGLSGSGKSSLAFDTIYAEGQRRYMESLSAYARQFLDQLDKPDVDYIEGLSPAISIDQKSGSKNPRSTVGTVTEIYDYLRIFFSSIGTAYCPNCKKKIQKMSIQEIVDTVMSYEKDVPITIMAPLIKNKKGEFQDLFEQLQKDGFRRIRLNDDITRLDEVKKLNKQKKHTIELIVDRVPVSEENQGRIFQSIETAAKQSDGLILVEKEGKTTLFSEHCSCPDCNFSIAEISPRLFSFNSPIGACQICNGLGEFKDFDGNLLIKEPSKPIYKATGKIIKLRGTHLGRIVQELYQKLAIDYDTPFNELSKKHQNIILYGAEQVDEASFSSQNTKLDNKLWSGLIPLLRSQFNATYSERKRFFYRIYMSHKACSVCNGNRLNPAASNIKIRQHTINNFTAMQITALKKCIEGIKFSEDELTIIKQVKKEILNRLSFLDNVGLGYLTLNRKSGTLSGGEFQRIRLATQIGSALTGVLYVLDEPSIGLHQHDNDRLIETLKTLRDIGNTLIIVEHDDATILEADHVVEIGPGAGIKGGKIIFSGSKKEFLKSDCITSHYVTGKKKIEIPKYRRNPKKKGKITLTGVKENNLKDITVSFPLGKLICITGVSGSGKSTLIYEVLHKALMQELHEGKEPPGKFKSIKGIENIDKVITIDQSPIGRTPRSNPVTYVGVFTAIRELFTQTPESKIRGYKAGRFSFNVKGGRCEACEGDGLNKIEMHFLSDVYVTCDVCKGKRFNKETLQVKYKGYNISDVLEMTVNKACDVFENIPAIIKKLKTIQEVGLGYITLGQSATTLSGGEAQRVKLAKELSKKSTGKTLYLLDEPTTGLHFEDIKQLLNVINRLVDHGNTAIIIEHNLDVIKTADHIIDIGPGGGQHGGSIVFSDAPENAKKYTKSLTGKYLKNIIK
tara:strand:- start:1859 stop:4660 length:2802 start_codon:yes stop_codon:yes gene_type:complete